jgi:drug/metabolite transporter (DMT)-like permease
VNEPAARRNVDAAGAALALLVSVFWGVNPVAIKLGLLDAPPIRLAGLRFLVGGAVIVGWAALTGRLGGLRIASTEWRPLLVVTAIFIGQIATMNVGTALTSAAHAAILLNLYSVHTVVLAHFLIPGDRLSARKMLGVGVAYAGIAILFTQQGSTGSATAIGDVIMFVSALLLADRTVYLARVVHRLDPVKLLLAQATLGAAVFFSYSAVMEPARVTWTSRLALSVAFQGIVVAGFNFVINLWLLRHYRPSALAAFFLTQPIFGVVAAALVVGDRLTPGLLIASGAVAVGIGIASRARA